MLLLATALVALVGAQASNAERVVHVNDFYDFSSFSFELPDCGTTVTTTISGAWDVTLIYNDEGLLVKMIADTPAASVTYSSPYGSFGYPVASTSIFTFPEGATPGAPASATYSGLFLRVPGLQPNAGTFVFDNLILSDESGGFSEETGFPYLQQTLESTVTFHGVAGVTGENFYEAFCAALGPPA
jgi:hypothetical protein